MTAVLRDLGDHAFEEFGNELRRRGAMRGEMKVVYEEIRTTTTRVALCVRRVQCSRFSPVQVQDVDLPGLGQGR